MSDSVATSSLGPTQDKFLANDIRARIIEDEPRERLPKPHKISPRATLDALSGLRISRERVLIPETLGMKAQGASASVQLAILLPPKEEHPEHPSAQGQFVALKQFRLDDDKGDKEGLAPLAHELSLLRNLKHKHVVRGLGFVENVAQGTAWIVLPWAANGNLRDYVRSRSALWGLNISPRFALIEDVTRGLDYLHGQSEPICHGDLKSLNILVDGQQNAVITDFGSARIIGEGWEARGETARRSYSPRSQPPEGPRVEFSVSTGSITMTNPSYTIRWAAPEVLDGELPMLASDIWSLGWIYWEVLTGKFPFNDILRDQDVIIGVLGGELPKPQTALARTIEPRLSTLVTINSLCKLMETCLAMDPQNRPKCCDAAASLRDMFSDPEEHRAREKKVIDSLAFLHAMSEKYLSEGRLGEAIRYIQEFRRVARRTKRELATITSQELLNRCRRSTSGVETVHEEEAGTSWNLALACFDGQLYQEAERHVINAARLYRELGFEAQALECDQFLNAIQDAMGTLLQYPEEGASYNKNLPKLLLTHPERFSDPVPSAEDTTYEYEKKRSEIVWLAAGALQCAPDPLATHMIVSLITKYHPGKIPQCREAWDWSEKGTDTEFMEYILSRSKAFEAHETHSGYWHLSDSELHHLPPFPPKRLLRITRKVRAGEGERVKIQTPSGLSKHRARDEEAVACHVCLQAVSEKHLFEGRLGEAIQYIQESRRVAGLTKTELAPIAFQELLERCRRSISGIEEKAGLSWNLALTFFADQLYQDAERQVIDAARLYNELGFEIQTLECDQFLDAIQDAMGTVLQYPEGEAAICDKDLPKLLLTQPERFREPVTSVKDPIYECQKQLVEMVWLVAGALQCVSPDPIAVERIVSLIEEYHPGKIQQCHEAWDWPDKGTVYIEDWDGSKEVTYTEAWGRSKKRTDKEFINYILWQSPAFERTGYFYWRLGGLDSLPPFPRKDLFCGYFTPLGSPEKPESTAQITLNVGPGEGGRVTFKTL